MYSVNIQPFGRAVALRKESVDRNNAELGAYKVEDVALRKESVDRNLTASTTSRRTAQVALRKESVDRNVENDELEKTLIVVALRKESVDRNKSSATHHSRLSLSLSARRAWIEISCSSA